MSLTTLASIIVNALDSYRSYTYDVVSPHIDFGDKFKKEVTTQFEYFVLPVDMEEDGFYRNYNDQEMLYWNSLNKYDGHYGIDLLAPKDSPVYAAAAGKITNIYFDDNLEWCIEIAHIGGKVSYYKSLSENRPEGIEIGTEVQAGQHIGYVGLSRMEQYDPYHLHFEVSIDGVKIDPFKCFDKTTRDYLWSQITKVGGAFSPSYMRPEEIY